MKAVDLPMKTLMATDARTAHKATWLCPDAPSRERLLDMDDRLKRPRGIAFAILGLAVASTIPVLGWAPVALLLLALLGFALMDVVRRRSARPEYAIVASWAFAQVLIAVAVALTGGSESHAISWFIIPVVTLPARFGLRGLAAGVALSVVLIVGVTVGVTPVDEVPQAYATVSGVAALLAISVLMVALMRSDVDHRTEAVVDDLTGMLNRRALGHRLEELRAQSRIATQPIALIAGDVDRFKRVNDQYGHATGDRVLVDLSHRLRTELRAFDLVYRVGGEEFLILLPGARVSEACGIAEGLRQAVSASPISGLDVTMSFGVAGSGGGLFDPDFEIAAADCALYAAKHGGRNQVVGEDQAIIAVSAMPAPIAGGSPP